MASELNKSALVKRRAMASNQVDRKLAAELIAKYEKLVMLWMQDPGKCFRPLNLFVTLTHPRKLDHPVPEFEARIKSDGYVCMYRVGMEIPVLSPNSETTTTTTTTAMTGYLIAEDSDSLVLHSLYIRYEDLAF